MTIRGRELYRVESTGLSKQAREVDVVVYGTGLTNFEKIVLGPENRKQIETVSRENNDK